jgi:5-formyltetrahydrofolate cyclo-ligase
VPSLTYAHPLLNDDLVVPSQQVKDDLRERIRAERHERGPAHHEAASLDLAAVALEVPDIARAGCVATYVSTSTTPGTTPLRQALRAAGVQVLLPVPLSNGHLDWYVDADDGHSPHGQRPEPEPGDSRLLGVGGVQQAQAMITPALAVDTLGNRLGQGTGFYDRTLRLVDQGVPVFAMVYDGEVLDAAIEPVPAEPHDRPVDAVITPHRCLRLLPAHQR